MGSLINDIITDKGFTLEAPLTESGLERLYETGREYAWSRAESANIYYSHSLDNLRTFDEHEPDAAEVREHLVEGDLGNWRKVMQTAAMIATDRALTVQLEEDIERLRAALREAGSEGYAVRGLANTCVHGWAPHASETTWKSGVLLRWARLEGGPDAYLLRVRLWGGATVWIDLEPEA